MVLSLKNSIVFEFTLFLPMICFNLFGLKLSRNLSLMLARLTQSVKRCFTVFAWLWHSSHSGTGRPSIKTLWASNVWQALSKLITVSSFLHILFSFHGRVSGLIYLSLSFFSFHSVFHFSCMASLIMETSLDRGMLSFVLSILMLHWHFCLRIRLLEPLRFQVSSRTPLFFQISVGLPRCASVFVHLGFVGNLFWSSCM